MKTLIFSLMVVALLGMHIVQAAQTQTQTQNFEDIPQGAWYEEAVQFMHQWEFMTGDTNGNFDPHRSVNRAELAMVMYRFYYHLENQFQLSPVVGTMDVDKNETFTITLDANPSTGYEWQVNFDEDYLDLTDRDFEADSELLGSSGEETFQFKALESGTTYIYFIYLRPFEEDEAPIEKQIYKIRIS
jgi:inhibitor of cysteine peptidase